MLSTIKWIIIFVVVCVAIVLLVWFLRSQCSRKENRNVGTVRRIEHLVPSAHRANSSRSTPYLPFISPYPPKPPPLGFGHPVDMPQPDIGETSSFFANGNLDTYPQTRGAPYPVHSESRAPYPLETSCYPPAHTAPYPVASSMPQPSSSRISYSSERNIQGTSNFTRITPYPPDHQAPYPPSNEYVIPRPSLSRTPLSSENITGQTLYSRRTAPYPPAGSASGSSELPPPAYEDAIKKKF